VGNAFDNVRYIILLLFAADFVWISCVNGATTIIIGAYTYSPFNYDRLDRNRPMNEMSGAKQLIVYNNARRHVLRVISSDCSVSNRNAHAQYVYVCVYLYMSCRHITWLNTYLIIVRSTSLYNAIITGVGFSHRLGH